MPRVSIHRPPLEIAAPDIEPHAAGNTGIPYVTTFDSGKPGPHAVVNAVTHGNEICGAIAVCWLFEQQVRPVRGKLTLSFTNVEAFQSYSPDNLLESRCVEEDINRVWDDATLDGPRKTRDLLRARALLPLVASADFLLDIHSMSLPCPPLLLCGRHDKTIALGRGIGLPATLVRDGGFTSGAQGTRMRDYGAFDDPAKPQVAMLVECGQHWAQSSVDVAVECALRFMRHAGVVEAAWVDARLSQWPKPRQRQVDVTGILPIRTDSFRWAMPFIGMETIPKAGTIIAYDGEEPVRSPYDNLVLVMPTQRPEKGKSAVRLGQWVD